MIFLFWGEGMGWHQISEEGSSREHVRGVQAGLCKLWTGGIQVFQPGPVILTQSWVPGPLGPQVFDKYVGRRPPPRLLHLSLHCLQLCPPRTKPLHWLQSATVETSKYSTQTNLTKKKNHAGRTVHIISCSVNHSGPDCLKASSVFFF